MLKLRIFCCALAVLSFMISPFMGSQSSAAYAATDNYYAACGGGQHNIFFQEEMPLKVLIKSGTATSGWTQEHNQKIRKAFKEVASVSGGKLSFQFVSKKPFDIVCKYQPLGSHNAYSWEGAVTHKTTGPHHIEDATIIFHSDDKSFSNLQRFYEVALHEVGHAVGLGHSTDPGDIMYKKVSETGSKSSYSPRDIKTLSMLYRYKPSAEILRMVERHKIEKLSGGNMASIKVSLPGDKQSVYSSKATNYLQGKFSGGSSGKSCTVKFLVDRKGEVFKENIDSSSGDSQFDRKVLDVVTASMPLPAVDGLRMAEVTEMHLKFSGDGTVTDLAPRALVAQTPVAETAVAPVTSSDSTSEGESVDDVIAAAKARLHLGQSKSDQPKVALAKPALAKPLVAKPAVADPFATTPAAAPALAAKPAVATPKKLNFKVVEPESKPDVSSQPQQRNFKVVEPDTDSEPTGKFKVVREESDQVEQSKPQPSSSSSGVASGATGEAASSIGAASSGGTASSAWVEAVRRKALTNQKSLNLAGTMKIQVLMRLKPDGNIQSLTLKSTCGLDFIDKQALKQCRNQAPYPMPSSGSGQIKEVLVIFGNN